MFQVSPLFAVPMVEAQLPDAGPLNAQLRELFLARAAEGRRWANPASSMKVGSGLFESDFTVFSWPEPPVQALREFCWAALSRAIGQLGGFGAEQLARLQILSHTWFHITRHGGQFDLHNHAMASWSGVYCVDPGDSPDEDPDSGALTFLNPMGLAGMFHDPANVRLRRPYGLGNINYRHQPGRLVLFPSWLFHMVQPYRGQRERITVAFNCWFKQAGD